MQISRENLDTAKTFDRYATVSLPKGWRELGSGCDRTAYKGPDGLVYKVSSWSGEHSQNLHEARRCWEIRNSDKRPEWLFVPKAHYDAATGIVVMEWVRGKAPNAYCGWRACKCEGSCWTARTRWLARELGMGDLHHKNVKIMPDGKLGVFDLGM